MITRDIMKQLIAHESISGQEASIQQWIYHHLQDAGLRPQMVVGNIVCCIPGVTRTKALIFNGHVDTVSAGDLAAWQTPPFQASLKDGKLYGLGASDMKSGIAVMLKLAQHYSQQKPPFDLWFHFVVQEETNGQGTHDAMHWFGEKHLAQYQQAAGILLEPTNLETITIAHRGNIFLEITATGDSGHGSQPELAKNQAINQIFEAAKQLQQLVNGWGATYSNKLLGAPTVVLTSIRAGNPKSPNKIAGSCVATFDLRTTPEVHDDALTRIKSALGDSVEVKTVYDPLPYGYTKESERIVTVAQEVTCLPTATTPGSTDMLFFTALSIPAIIFGPGTKDAEHKPNEYVELAKIEQTVIYLEQIIEEF